MKENIRMGLPTTKLKRWQLIVAILAGAITIATFCGGAAYRLDSRYAKNSQFTQFKQRIDVKFIRDEIYSLRERIYQLEKYYGGFGVPTAPDVVKKEYRKLKKDLEELEQELDDLKKDIG